MTSTITPRRSAGQIEPLEARIAPATILIGAKGLADDIFAQPGDASYNPNDTDYVDPNPGIREGKNAAHPTVAYNQLNFVDIFDGSINGGPANPNDLIAAELRGHAVDANHPFNTLLDATKGRYFYLRLHAGDSVVTFSSDGYQPGNPLISVTAGDVIAVFTDSTNGGQSENNYDTDEFTGLILGPGAKVQVNGGVNGDIVTALNTHATAKTTDDTLDFANLVSPRQNVGNVKVLGGAVKGSVLSGGNIDNLTILSGSVENVLAGSAANSVQFDFVRPLDPQFANGRFTSTIGFAPGVVGASISNAVLHDVIARVEAGAGGFGAKGGSLTNITINADTDGLALIAGDGGTADLTARKTVGGAGGSLTKINVLGTNDTSLNSTSPVSIMIQGSARTLDGVMLVAGDGGGNGNAYTALRGGAGGSVSAVTAGIVAGTISSDLSADSFHIFGGLGGTGKVGGVGGSVSTSTIIVSTRDVAGHEIEVIAGRGGASGDFNPGGAAGAGGSITTISASNTFSSIDPAVSLHSSILVKAGDGGLALNATPTGATGAAGGSIRGVTLVGYDSEVTAGSGSSGKSGGKGGAITTVNYSTNQTVIPHNVLINAGQGGSGSSLAGGAGGAITSVKSALIDIETLHVNTAVGAGTGGSSVSGRGGVGGAVSSLDFTDVDKALILANFLNGDVVINGGKGGNGGTGGGAGGALSNLRVEGDHFSIVTQAGQGGDATVKGAGGAGGLISVGFFKSSGKLNGLDINGNPTLVSPAGTVAAGQGGAGAGAGGRGGAGGDLRTVSLSTEGDGVIKAGSGGNGVLTAGLVKGGAAGKGGSVSASGLISEFASGSILAGDAGVNGAAAAAGGTVIGSALNAVNGIRAAVNITIKGGSGSHGGAGGDVSTLGFAAFDPASAPTGKIVVLGGNGSGEGAVAGRGGNINAVTGVASSLADGTITTQITAGNGGGGVGVKASGAGGNVTKSTIATGGGVGSIIVIEAGNAGNGSAAATGGKGGSVTDFGFAALANGTVIRSIAAGEGGTGNTKGGAGGSVSQIFAPNNDIGYRTGEAFGYAKQGGIFAGAGGLGVKANGTNGSVTAVTATAISSIVAGARNNPIPHLAEKVSDISLNGSNGQLLLGRNDIFVPDGDFVLSFKGESTALIKGHTQASSTDPTAITVQSELNKLSSIQAAGGVIVEYTSTGGYRIQFNVKGNQPLIDAVEIVTRDVVETINNAALTLIFGTPTDGSVALPNTASQPGTTPFSTSELVTGSALFVAAEITSGNATSNTREVESFDITSILGVPNAEFTLSFVGETTARMLATSTAAQVETELNLLGSVQAAGGVTVTQSGSVFVVTFSQAGRQPILSGQTFQQEVERIDLTPIQASASSAFTLTFNGETTAPIPINATAFAIQTELNMLNSIAATNPNFFGTVTVNMVSTGVFDVVFSENGFQSLITGVATVPEHQIIHVTGAATDTFVIQSGDQKTVEFKMGATAEEVQVALNKLPNLITAGGVTVTKTGQDYDIAFNAVGSQSLLQPKLLQKEKQSVDLSTANGSTTDYTVHSEYPVYVDEINPGQTVFLPVPDGTPTLNINGFGNGPANTGRVTQVTAGSATLSEVDRIDFGAVNGPGGSGIALKDGDLFILKYTDTAGAGGSTENSIVVPYNTNIVTLAASVQAALNAMPLLRGGVTVIKDPNALFPNAVQITYTAKAAQVLLQFEGNTPGAHPGGYDLFPNYIGTTVQGGSAAEVQVLNLDTVVARGGFFNLTFAGQTTPFIPTSNNIVYNDISAQLNALSAISDFGGVTVAETSAGSHIYTITFQSTGARPQITGEAIVPESEVLNISQLAIDATNEFTLSFRGDSTSVLPQNASAALIQSELNQLPSVQMLSSAFPNNPLGSVRVFNTGPGQFRVDFPNYLLNNRVRPDTQEPDFQNIVIASGADKDHEIQHLDLRSLNAYADGLFVLDFNGEKTNPLPEDATALDIQNELNSLFEIIKTRQDPGVGFTGQVAVTQTAHGEFDVKFNNFGQKIAIDAAGTVNSERFPITVTQTSNGQPATIFVSEQVSGAYTSQPVIEVVKGSAGSPETQRIDLSGFNNAGLGDFTVTFGGQTTAPLTFTGGVAPTPLAVQQAINSLTTTPVGGVTVTGSNGVYDISFVANGDLPSLVVQGRHVEVQQIDLGPLYSSAAGEYALDFGGQKTANLAHNASASDIQTALSSLSTVQNAGGVTVQQVGNSSQFNVTFGGLGNQVSLVATGGLTQEVQRIALGELFGRSDAQFRLTFNGLTTGVLSANLSPAALAAEIETALNGLETINDTRTSADNPDHAVSAIGKVAVAAGENGNFFVTFDARGDVPAIIGYSIATTNRVIPVGTTVNGAATPVTVTSVDGTAGTNEVQTIDLSTLTASGANSEFQLQFDNNLGDTVSAYTTGLLTKGANPAATAQTIQTALNSLPSIALTGGVTVTVNAQDANLFDISFGQTGNQVAISGAVGQHEIQSVDVRALEKFHVTTQTTVDGDVGTQEHQVIDLTGARTDFTLQFGTDRTIALPANATLTEIQDALNTLPSVMAAGGVTLSPVASTATADRLIEVTFNNTGDVAPISGTADSADGVFRLGLNGVLTQALRVGIIDPNGPTTAQSLIDLADALNALPEVQALAGHNLGKVGVSLVNGSYQIDFLGLGDQTTLSADGTFSVQPSVDLHRVTDGTASASVPLPVSEATHGRAIGPVSSTLVQGSTPAAETQTIDLTEEFISGSGAVTLSFLGQPSAPVAAASPTIAADLQAALNSLGTVQGSGPGGMGGTVQVNETAPGSHIFTVTFSANGDQPLINAADSNLGTQYPVAETAAGASSVMEVQKLDLRGLPNQSFQVQFGGSIANINLNGIDQAANAAIIDAALDGLVPNGVTVTSNGDANGGFGTFNITFTSDGNAAQIGATSFATTETVQGGVTNEVQHLDLGALQGPSAAGSTFALVYNGEATAPLSRFATAAQVQTALNALPQFGGTPVTVAGSNGQFDVTFGDTVDHAGLILAQAGNQEVQHLDTSSLTAQGAPDFRLSFMNQQTGAIPANSSASQVEFELNQLPAVQQAGGVTVTATLDAALNITGYDVKFNTFTDQESITGSVAVHEQLILDLHNHQNEVGFLTFVSGTSSSIRVPVNAGAFAIQSAINSLSGNPVTVQQLHPGVFQISYLNAGSPLPALEAVINKEGNSVRIPANASATEIESALDNISVSDVSLTGANGLYQISYADNGDQILSKGTANVHEQLRTDIFDAQGSFHIEIGNEKTVELPARATADQIRLALNDLSAVKDLGGVKDVVVNPDSSFRVTFSGDYELPAIQFVARQNLLKDNVATLVDGDANKREVQTLSYTIQGAFDAAKFANARLVGAIADFNEFDSNRFHFYDLTQPAAQKDGNGNQVYNAAGVPLDVNNVPLPPVVATTGNPFNEGDLPIDGIVMAKVIDPKTTTFIPEAALIKDPAKGATGNLFFDYINGR